MEQGPGAHDSTGGHTGAAVDSNPYLRAQPPTAHLPPELRQRITSCLSSEDVVFGLRLSCREESLCYTEPVHRSAPLSHPLPGHVVDTAWCLEGAQAAMKQLTFRQKLLVPSTAAGSGCEANVEFALQLLQPHVFPVVLCTDHYWNRVLWAWGHQQCDQWPDLGSAVVSSGLAHLLPSLAQRCPGLLDPGRTLEAAAQHCDLAGLQAAWGAVGQQLQSGCDQGGRASARDTWRRVMCVAAGSEAADSLAKADWVLEQAGPTHRAWVLHPDVCGAAAASGDLARLAWLRERGAAWGTSVALAAVVREADLAFVQQLEQAGAFLPPVEDEWAWRDKFVLCEAAASPRDCVAKLHWLASRGAELGSWQALRAAAACGNLGAVQLLAGQPGVQPAGGVGDGNHLSILDSAVKSGSVPVAAWLRQAGYPMCSGCFVVAFQRGDLPMVRWLLEVGCPTGHCPITVAVRVWPVSTPAASGRLVEAVQLLAAAGWPVWLGGRGTGSTQVLQHQPHRVLVALWELVPAAAHDMDEASLRAAAATGCEATLEVLVGAGVLQAHGDQLARHWYADAAVRGDRGTLECLVRLGVPLGEGVLAAAVAHDAPVPALQWLVQQGAPRGGVEEVLQGVPPGRRVEVEVWLRGPPGGQ